MGCGACAKKRAARQAKKQRLTVTKEVQGQINKPRQGPRKRKRR